MKRSEFVHQLDRRAVETAIATAERLTSGEIRVAIVHQPVADPVAAAQALFQADEMHKTRERNGVLFYVAPASQSFAVIGDEGVHRECGQAFWEETAAAMAGDFRQGAFTAGLLAGISRAGELLARRFPRRSDDRNELPDTVVDG